jgi:hypothetical protein
VGATDEWKREAKNWTLAGRCIPRLCHDLRLRAFVIGTPTPEFEAVPGVVFSPPVPWSQLLGRLSGVRFLFVPNLLDASPRLLAEALCLNVPLLVNSSILGGWKYVNAFTGTFFEDESNVVEAAKLCLSRTYGAREWFRANYGPYLAGRRLLQLLKTVDSQLAESAYLRLGELSSG